MAPMQRMSVSKELKMQNIAPAHPTLRLNLPKKHYFPLFWSSSKNLNRPIWQLLTPKCALLVWCNKTMVWCIGGSICYGRSVRQLAKQVYCFLRTARLLLYCFLAEQRVLCSLQFSLNIFYSTNIHIIYEHTSQLGLRTKYVKAL